jgi:hypothetical protein
VRVSPAQHGLTFKFFSAQDDKKSALPVPEPIGGQQFDNIEPATGEPIFTHRGSNARNLDSSVCGDRYYGKR